MYPSVPASQPLRRWAALLAIVQVVLLTSSLVLAPALVIAQESPDPSPPSESAEPQAHSEPSADDNATSPSAAQAEFSHPGPTRRRPSPRASCSSIPTR